MDETPLYLDMPGSTTVNKKGCREVRVRSTGAEKRHLTVILACTAAGDMLPPMVIFKGKRALKNPSQRVLWSESSQRLGMMRISRKYGSNKSYAVTQKNSMPCWYGTRGTRSQDT